MAAPKKTTYVNTELDWAEQQLASWIAPEEWLLTFTVYIRMMWSWG